MGEVLDWGGLSFAVLEKGGQVYHVVEAGPKLQAQLDRMENRMKVIESLLTMERKG